jgi:hypothetical protein
MAIKPKTATDVAQSITKTATIGMESDILSNIDTKTNNVYIAKKLTIKKIIVFSKCAVGVSRYFFTTLPP